MLVARLTIHWHLEWLTEHSKVYFFMLNSAPKDPQVTQPEISQNVAEMLRLHEDILLEMKALVPDSHMQSTTAAQQQVKYPRWYSIESVEARSLEAPVTNARPGTDFSWFGTHRDQPLVMTAEDAAAIARVFERMVRKSYDKNTADDLNTDRLYDLAQTLLLIRGVWCQVRVYATEHGDAFEDHTKLVYL